MGSGRIQADTTRYGFATAFADCGRYDGAMSLDPSMTRRHFLGLSGAAAATALGGCNAGTQATANGGQGAKRGGSDTGAFGPERAKRAAAVAGTVDVAVIGAGLAGLTCARELLAGGVERVVVLEARERVGGRTVNQTITGGAVVEGGGQWIGPTQTEIIALARELGIDTFLTFHTGETVLYFQGFRFRESQLPNNARAQADVERAVATLDKMAARVPLEAPWTAPQAMAWDRMTLAEWIRANVKSADAREELTLEVSGFLSAPASRISLLYMLFYIASAGSLKALTSTRGGAQERRFVGGSQLLSLRMAAQLGERVVTGAPVTRIDTTGDSVRIESERGVVRARKVVVAMMPKDAARIAFAPTLPESHLNLLSKWTASAGDYKANLVYREPFWRAKGLSGQCVTDRPEVGFTMDNSPPVADGSSASSPGVLAVFTDPSSLPDGVKERRAAIAKALVPVFGRKARSPIDFVEMNWSREPFTSGCVSPLGPGFLTKYGAALRVPVGPIHWAGTETATVWTGYMEGAVRSGKRVARELINSLV